MDGRATNDGRDRDTDSSLGPTDPFANGVGRRRLLESSAAVGAMVSATDCLSQGSTEGVPTVFVFNNGDRTVSVIDAEADERLENAFIDTTASFPANQYGTSLDSAYDGLWLNVNGGVRAVDQHTLEGIERVETGYEPNYPNLTPDEKHLIVASGGTTTLDPEPDEQETHAIVRIDADRGSDEFGEVTGKVETEYTGPCDATLGPDGKYAFVPEIANETVAVFSVDPFEIVERVDVGDPVGDAKVLPFMGMASFEGETLLVENGEGELGTDPAIPREGSESIWDISDPTTPVERERITRDDGLPAAPITSEIGPDGEIAYLFTPDGESVTVIDCETGTVEGDLDVGGRSIAGAWGPAREKLYVPVQTANHVAVIDHAERAVAATVDAGASPTGAVAGTIRPDTDTSQRVRGSLAALGVDIGEQEMANCPDGHCYCG